MTKKANRCAGVTCIFKEYFIFFRSNIYLYRKNDFAFFAIFLKNWFYIVFVIALIDYSFL